MNEKPPELAAPGNDGKRASWSCLQAWLVVFLWMLVIFAFSQQPHSGQVTAKVFGPYNIAVRKIAHVSEFAVLAVLLWRAWTKTLLKGGIGRFCNIASLAISALYALTDEWHQTFVPGRSACLSDAAIDTGGALLGLLVRALATRFF